MTTSLVVQLLVAISLVPVYVDSFSYRHLTSPSTSSIASPKRHWVFGDDGRSHAELQSSLRPIDDDAISDKGSNDCIETQKSDNGRIDNDMSSLALEDSECISGEHGRDDNVDKTGLESEIKDIMDESKPKTKSPNRRMQVYSYLSQPIVETRVIGLVLLSSFLQAINTLDDLPDMVHRGVDAIDDIFVYIFAMEFFLRWWCAGNFKVKYLTRPLAAIDAVVVILPLILSGLLPIWDFGVTSGILPHSTLPIWLVSSTANSGSALLNLRLLRIVKFQRVLTDENTYTKFSMALGMRKTEIRPYQLQLARVVVTIFTLVSVSTGLIYTAEHEVNPQIPDYFSALYFGLTTLTTVGFGDITPVTTQGRLVVGLSIMAGVSIIPAQAASLAEAYLDFQMDRGRKPGAPLRRRGECKQCGASPHRGDAGFCWSCGSPLE